MTDVEFEANALAHARRQTDRIHREVELLVAIAASPIQAVAVLKDLNVTADCFVEEENRCLFVLLDFIGKDTGSAWDWDKILDNARALLTDIHHWNDNQTQSYLRGCIWGPGPLRRLFNCCDFDPALIQRCAKALALVKLE